MRILILISLLFSTASLAADIPAEKDIISFPGKVGTVTFQHKLHSELTNVGGIEKVECSTCHHTYEGEGNVKACSECHIKSKKAKVDGAPNLKKAYHYRCQNCHKYTVKEGKKAGPVKKCKLCHIKDK
jgi:hypothetical protein